MKSAGVLESEQRVARALRVFDEVFLRTITALVTTSLFNCLYEYLTENGFL
jgi:hypothetical protein